MIFHFLRIDCIETMKSACLWALDQCFQKFPKREIALTLVRKNNDIFENDQNLTLLEEIEKSVSRGTTGKLEGKLDSFRSW